MTTEAKETEAGPTKYRAIKQVEANDGDLDALIEAGNVFVLLPEEYEGASVLKQAHATHGDGVYGKFPARGFETKPVRKTEVVKIG